ncbi:MAG: hypothetical protein MZV63_33435 [Marinilabiliales bacterium]|nr:hypothetical protein [Marinilabiliales bacterium]
MNYTLQEYANDVVSQVSRGLRRRAACRTPTSSPSRAARWWRTTRCSSSTSSASNEILAGPDRRSRLAEDEHAVIQQLLRDLRGVSRKNFQEAYHDALQLKEEAITALQPRAARPARRAPASSELFWATLREDPARSSASCDYVPDELEGLEKQLADTYYCNFSLFQSMPDHWAVQAALPDHADPPAQRAARRGAAIIADLTCDSRRQDRPVHRPARRQATSSSCTRSNGEPYLHRRLPGRRLPGDPRRPAQPLRRHRRRARRGSTSDDYRVDHVVEGDSVTEVLALRAVPASSDLVAARAAARSRRRCARSASPSRSRRCSCGATTRASSGYTYLEEAEPEPRLDERHGGGVGTLSAAAPPACDHRAARAPCRAGAIEAGRRRDRRAEITHARAVSARPSCASRRRSYRAPGACGRRGGAAWCPAGSPASERDSDAPARSRRSRRAGRPRRWAANATTRPSWEGLRRAPASASASPLGTSTQVSPNDSSAPSTSTPSR